MPRSGRFTPRVETCYALYRRQLEGYYSYLMYRISTLELFLSFCLFVCKFLARQPPVGQCILIQEFSRSHTTTHRSRQDCSGIVISPSPRPLPDNSHDRHPCPRVGFDPTISAGERPNTYVLDREATGTGSMAL